MEPEGSTPNSPDTVLALLNFPVSSIYDMAILPGGDINAYPMVDQLNEPTSDGAADENARMNCVFASCASVAKHERPDLAAGINGDYIKDHSPAYGQGYLGGASGERVAPTMKELYDVTVDVVYDTNAWNLLGAVIHCIDQNHAALVSMPSRWGTQPTLAGYNPLNPDWPTHAGAAFGYNPTTRELAVMNPWGGFRHTGSYDYWTTRFCYGKVYPTSGPGGSTVPIPTGWTEDADGTLHNPTNGWVCVRGFAHLIKSAAYWEADDVPIENEHGTPQFEYHNPGFGSDAKTRVQQTFHKTQLYAIEKPDGSWVLGKEWIGDEVLWLRQNYEAGVAKIADLQAQLDAAKNVPPPTPPELTIQEASAKVRQSLKDMGLLG